MDLYPVGTGARLPVPYPPLCGGVHKYLLIGLALIRLENWITQAARSKKIYDYLSMPFVSILLMLILY